MKITYPSVNFNIKQTFLSTLKEKFTNQLTNISEILNTGRGHDFVVFETISRIPPRVWFLKPFSILFYIKLDQNSSTDFKLHQKKIFRLKIKTI